MTAAKKTEASVVDSQVIFLRGSQRGGKDGDRRTVDAETAALMVAAGTARYPASKE